MNNDKYSKKISEDIAIKQLLKHSEHYDAIAECFKDVSNDDVLYFIKLLLANIVPGNTPLYLSQKLSYDKFESVDDFKKKFHEFFDDNTQSEDFGITLSKYSSWHNHINFSFENLIADEDLDEDYQIQYLIRDILGFKNIGDLYFYGFYAGGDWEFPVYNIIFFNEGRLQCYTPYIGNVYNYVTKKAFDNDATDSICGINDKTPNTPELNFYDLDNFFDFYNPLIFNVVVNLWMSGIVICIIGYIIWR